MTRPEDFIRDTYELEAQDFIEDIKSGAIDKVKLGVILRDAQHGRDKDKKRKPIAVAFSVMALVLFLCVFISALIGTIVLVRWVF